MDHHAPFFTVAFLEHLARLRPESLDRLCSRRPSTGSTAASRIEGQGKACQRSDAVHRRDMMGVEGVHAVAAHGRREVARCVTAGDDDTEHAAPMPPAVDGTLAPLLVGRTELLGTLHLERRPPESGGASALLLQNVEGQARQSGGVIDSLVQRYKARGHSAETRGAHRDWVGIRVKGPICGRCLPAVDTLGSETVARDERDDS